MKLNHLTVTDVVETAKFLKKYFGQNQWGKDGGKDNEKFTVLLDEDGFVLTLMKAEKGTEINYPGFFNMGLFRKAKSG